MKRVIAIIGSLSARSSNKAIIEHIAGLAAHRLEVEIYDGIRDLPQFDPDLDTDNPPEKVTEFRHAIKASEAVLVSTPEYIFGVPGALKNALDWTVSTADFREKPVAFIVASTSGEKAYESLLLTLQTIEAVIPDSCSLLIPHVKAKIKGNGKIDHEQTSNELKSLADSFVSAIQA